MIARVSPRVAYIAIGAAGACGVFVVPWFVPVRGAPVLSDSYMLGFANTAATLALWAASLLLVLVARAAPRHSTADRAGERSRPASRCGRLRRASIAGCESSRS